MIRQEKEISRKILMASGLQLCNDYLHRVKHFIRWLHNRNKSYSDQQDWQTPSFALIKEKKTNRLSPYIQRARFGIGMNSFPLFIMSHTHATKRHLALLWDLDARNHEITALRIKDIRFRENYAEGEIPHSTKKLEADLYY